MKVKVFSRILEANDRIAEENRKRFKEAGVFVANLMGAPGAPIRFATNTPASLNRFLFSSAILSFASSILDTTLTFTQLTPHVVIPQSGRTSYFVQCISMSDISISRPRVISKSFEPQWGQAKT